MVDQRPTWLTAFGWLLSPILLILSIRWLFFEPYVIPSGSMIPQLLIHDHILVNKMKYGVRIPFGSTWLAKWGKPQRGEIVVFRYPNNPDVFYVKRVIGLPGERISIIHGVVHIDEKPLDLTEQDSADSEFQYFLESQSYQVQYLNKEEAEMEAIDLPEDHYFMMGDNRDQSSDSRSWGAVPYENLIGTPVLIWLSCEETFETARFLCDPSQMRWNRILMRL